MTDSGFAFRPHPWHGLSPGDRFPDIVTAYIEIVPTDGVKYEIDKQSGYLKVDRPQRFSSFCPTLYGFVPQTLSGSQVAGIEIPGVGRVQAGDDDPLDVCVLTDRPIQRGEIILSARTIGGLRMVDNDQADDKILLVLLGDPTFGEVRDASLLPVAIVDRLRHYFLTYKAIPGEEKGASVTMSPLYSRDVALRVLEASRADYRASFGG